MPCCPSKQRNFQKAFFTKPSEQVGAQDCIMGCHNPNRMKVVARNCKTPLTPRRCNILLACQQKHRRPLFRRLSRSPSLSKTDRQSGSQAAGGFSCGVGIEMSLDHGVLLAVSVQKCKLRCRIGCVNSPPPPRAEGVMRRDIHAT